MSFAGHSHIAFIGAMGVWIAVVFAAITRWTGASRREALCGAAGGLVAGAVNMATDAAARALGWWRYPEVTTPFGPVLYYIEAGIGCGALALLMRWLGRRYGRRAQWTFIAALAVYAPIRDAATAASTHLIEFHYDPLPVVLVADAASSFVIPVLVAYALLRLVAGSAASR